jgi:hypothetical protein
MCFFATTYQFFIAFVRNERYAIVKKVTSVRAFAQFNMKSIEEYLNNPSDIGLARHLADTLNDQASLAYYVILAQTYPHQLLLDILESIMRVPEDKITTRRAAIFVANVKRHVPGT